MRDWKALSDEEFQKALQERSVQEGLEIMENLGFKNIPLGQATNVTPVDNWREVGLACRFEHCILQMPEPLVLSTANGPVNLFNTHHALAATVCPNFGRVCPGGVLQVLQCFGVPEKEEPADGEVTEEQTESATSDG